MALDEKDYRIPYSERRAIKKHLVPRTKKLKRRRLFFRLAFLAFILISVAVYLAFASHKPQQQQYEQQPTPKTQAKPVVTEITTSTIFAVYVVENNLITDFLVCGYEKESNSLSIMTFDSEIYAPVLGLEIQKIGELHRNFAQALYYSIKNVFPYEISGLYELNTGDLSSDMLRARASEIFSDLAKAYPELSFIASRVKNDNIEILPVPTELSDLGDTRAIIVDLDKMRQAAEILYSDTFDKKKVCGEVVVMNGSGEPAAALNASFKLIEAGFRVINIKNADRFDYLNTEISCKDEKMAEEISSVLGVGKLSQENAGTEVVDAVIIIGKDFEAIMDKSEDQPE